VGIPIDTHPMLMFYNKKLFTDAGLDAETPPATREDFEATITAIQEQTEADGYQMVSTGAPANFLVGLQWAGLFYQGGGEWTNGDFSQVTFNSEPGVQASTYLAHLVNDIGVKKVDSDAEVNAFQQGTNAMMWNGIWQMSRAQEALGDDLGIAPIPEIFGPGTWGGSHNLALTTAAANDPNLKQAAYYFMDWFSQNSLNWGAAGQIPARNEVREAVSSATEGLLPLIAQVVPVAENVKFLPSIPGAASLFDQANSAGEAAVLAVNGEDPKAVLDRNAQAQTEILLQNKERYGF
jgi:multiple sugar transport system substrate-binding protein